MNISKYLWSTLVIQKVHLQGLGTTSQLAWLVRRSTYITLCGHLPVFSPCLLKDHPWSQKIASTVEDVSWLNRHFVIHGTLNHHKSNSQNPCWCCFISFATPPELPGSTVACLMEGLGLMPVFCWATKNQQENQQESKIWCSTKRCYKMPKDHVPEEAAINMSKSLHHFSENFTISSTSWPHTGVCPSWCCSAASMGGFNSLTR